MGKGIVEKLKKEYDIEEEWIGYELHPETPPEGKPLQQLFPGLDAEKMIMGLNRAGAPYGVLFKSLDVVANSRLALEAGEFARGAGKFEEAHTRLFRAYFQEGENIGNKSSLLRLLGEIGLNRQQLNDALDNNVFSARLQNSLMRARQHEVSAVPTFIVNGKDKIVGAQPYNIFERCLNKCK